MSIIRFEYHENIANNPPFKFDRFDLFVDDLKVGYLKASYIPSSSGFADSIISYLKLKGAACLSIDHLDELSELDPEKLKMTVYLLAQNAKIGWHESNHLATDAVRQDDVIQFLYDNNVIQQLYMLNKRAHESHVKRFVDVPLVDYIKVYENHRGNGYAEMLYCHVATFYHDMGMRFRLTDLLCCEAVGRVHEKMEEKGLIEREDFDWFGQTESFKFMVPVESVL